MTMAQTIAAKLTTAFAPSALSVIDDSDRHAGHAGAIAKDGSQGETHFTVRIVSEQFSGLSRLERQRRVYGILAEELAGRVHALSLSALAPKEV